MNSNLTPAGAGSITTARHTGAKGGVIQTHHALRNIVLTKASLLTILLLPLIFDVVIWYKLDAIIDVWAKIFQFWLVHFGNGKQLLYTEVDMLHRTFYIPYPDFPFYLPTAKEVWFNALFSLIAFLISMFLPRRWLPIIYLIRAGILIQISASVYFFLHPSSFPYDIGDYISGELTLGINLLLLVPPILGLVYYIFDFSFIRKFLTTLWIVAYFIVLLPFQYFLHALIISSWGLLFMPVLYLLFGFLLDTLMFISWYAWAMSKRSLSGRGASAIRT